jgi:hypothetical protein
LLDTDGCVKTFGTKKKCSFDSTSPHLIAGVVDLIRGLGGIAYLTEDFENDRYKSGYCGGVKFRIPFNPFTLPVKADKFDEFAYTQHFQKKIVNIQKIDNDSGACFTVDNEEHLFVIKDYNVTHNTMVAMNCALDALDANKINKIIIARPAIGTCEGLGFVKGDSDEKMAEWVVPMYELVQSRYGVTHAKYMVDSGVIELLPLHTVTGRSFNNVYVIVDECFEDGAEVLTKRGWVKFQDLEIDEEIMQYNADGTSEFVKPSRIITKEYDGDMHYITKDRFYSAVTAGHRRVFNDYKGNLTVKEARQGFSQNEAIITSSNYIGGKNSLTEDQMGLICMLQADGYLDVEGKYHGWQISVSKEKKITRIKGILDNLGIKYSESDTDSNGKIRFYIGRLNHQWPEFYDYLDVNKTFTNNFYDLDIKSIENFVVECVFWDGHESKSGTNMYCSTNKSNAELFQTMVHLTNRSSKLMKAVDNRKSSYRDYYRPTVKNTGTVGLHGTKDTIKNYKGLVHCATVPSGMLVVRQKDYIQVSGNCQGVNIATMNSLITRMGKWSKLVLLGDVRQELMNKSSGIKYLLNLCDKYDMDFDIINFTIDDCVRSEKVKNRIKCLMQEGIY